ncbi:hypothetical protein SEA_SCOOBYDOOBYDOO_135 [Mycobacterium phage ScoobyDoobyDoo]|nr:hypothetical protein SEA_SCOOBYDOOBYDOO_135 [Mycobacterium phage ScoobyDoobyDoo]
MTKHAIENYITDEDARRAFDAAAMARVTGSRGCTDVVATDVEVSVNAIDQIEPKNLGYGGRTWGPAYRITSHQDLVIVLPGRPGRYHGHAAT